MKKLDSDNFEEETKEGNAIVDFWAPWCGPCRVLGPNFEAASREHDDVKFLKLNVDEEPGIASDMGVRSIPTMIFFRDGKKVGSVTGSMSKDGISQKIAEFFS